MIFALTDETYSLVCSKEDCPEGMDYHTLCILISLFKYLKKKDWFLIVITIDF